MNRVNTKTLLVGDECIPVPQESANAKDGRSEKMRLENLLLRSRHRKKTKINWSCKGCEREGRKELVAKQHTAQTPIHDP